ncbi:MAG: GNAT family N-acetyltransferase [Peptococcaceae bacterium]|nr:GNAT family N-acetyltransferase [Peptococcaceae bacterium]
MSDMDTKDINTSNENVNKTANDMIQRVFKKFPTLQSQRFLLRRPDIEDGQQLYMLARNPAVSHYLPWNPHRSVGETLAVLEMHRHAYQDGTAVTWGIDSKSTRTLVGLVGITNIDVQNQSVDLDYWLGEEYWGHGYMVELLRSIITFCCVGMGITRVQGKHVKENQAPGRVMLKAGMSYEGTLRKNQFFKGRIWDVLVYSVLSDDVLRMPSDMS